MVGDIPQSVASAADNVAAAGILGSLLILSIAGNIAAVWALIRCYKGKSSNAQDQ